MSEPEQLELSVVIPFSEMQRLLNMISEYQLIDERLKSVERQLPALRSQYVECLDKIREIM